MEGRCRPEGMSEEQFAEAQRLFEVTQGAIADEVWRMSCLMASKRDHQLLGKTEFELRDIVHRIGAITLEEAVNERRKKGGTRVVAPHAPATTKIQRPPATTMPASSRGGRNAS